MTNTYTLCQRDTTDQRREDTFNCVRGSERGPPFAHSVPSISFPHTHTHTVFRQGCAELNGDTSIQHKWLRVFAKQLVRSYGCLHLFPPLECIRLTKVRKSVFCNCLGIREGTILRNIWLGYLTCLN